MARSQWMTQQSNARVATNWFMRHAQLELGIRIIHCARSVFLSDAANAMI
jgi:hypothetical protein